MTRRLSFRPRQRLRRQRDFDRVFARRCTAADRLLVVYVEANGLAWTRLGIKTARRLGGAVTRSRIRRRLREAFRLGQHELPVGLDVVCIPRESSAAQADVAHLGQSLKKLIQRAAAKLSPPDG